MKTPFLLTHLKSQAKVQGLTLNRFYVCLHNNSTSEHFGIHKVMSFGGMKAKKNKRKQKNEQIEDLTLNTLYAYLSYIRLRLRHRHRIK